MERPGAKRKESETDDERMNVMNELNEEHCLLIFLGSQRQVKRLNERNELSSVKWSAVNLLVRLA